MKKAFEQLQELQKTIQSEIEKQNETYNHRSEPWRDSTKGMDFIEKTSALVSVGFALEEAVVEFETYNEL